MKKVLIPLVLVVVLLAASPWLVGLRARSVVEDFTQELDAIPAYNASVASYTMGYLSSEAVIDVGYDMTAFLGDMTPEQRAELQDTIDMMAEGLSLRLDIKHGPLLQSERRQLGLFSADVALEEDSDALQSFKDENGIDVLMTTRAEFAFNGDGEIVFNAPPFSIDTDDGDSFAFGGFDYRVDVQRWNQRFDASGTVYESSGNGDNAILRLAPLTIRAHGEPLDHIMLWAGEASFATDGVFLVGAEGGSLEEVSMTVSSTSPTENTMDLSYQFNVGRLSGGDMLYALEDLVVHGSAVNISKDALREMYEVMSDPARSQDPESMMAAVGAMYGGDAELRIDEVSFRYGPDVDVHLTGAFSFGDGFFTSLANAATVPPDPMQILGGMTLSMSLDFSQGVVDAVIDLVLRNQVSQMAPEATPEQIDQLIELQKVQLNTMIPGLVQGGMLRQAGRGYQADLQLEGGTLTINGNPVPIPGLQ